MHMQRPNQCGCTAKSTTCVASADLPPSKCRKIAEFNLATDYFWQLITFQSCLSPVSFTNRAWLNSIWFRTAMSMMTMWHAYVQQALWLFLYTVIG